MVGDKRRWSKQCKTNTLSPPCKHRNVTVQFQVFLAPRAVREACAIGLNDIAFKVLHDQRKHSGLQEVRYARDARS